MKLEAVTPAQMYAKSVIDAIDELLATGSKMSYYKIGKMLMERPKTLRCAMAAYFYKSRVRQL